MLQAWMDLLSAHPLYVIEAGMATVIVCLIVSTIASYRIF